MGCLPGSRDAVNDGTAKIPMPSVLERRSQRRNSENSVPSVSERQLSTTEEPKIGAFRARETAVNAKEQRKFRCLPYPKGAPHEQEQREIDILPSS